MHIIEIPHKNKSLFHVNACSLNKNFHDLQHLLSCTKTKFDIKTVTETRITKQVSLLNNLDLNNYSFEFTLRLQQVVLFFTLLIIYHVNVEMP